MRNRQVYFLLILLAIMMLGACAALNPHTIRNSSPSLPETQPRQTATQTKPAFSAWESEENTNGEPSNGTNTSTSEAKQGTWPSIERTEPASSGSGSKTVADEPAGTTASVGLEWMSNRDWSDFF